MFKTLFFLALVVTTVYSLHCTEQTVSNMMEKRFDYFEEALTDPTACDKLVQLLELDASIEGRTAFASPLELLYACRGLSQAYMHLEEGSPQLTEYQESKRLDGSVDSDREVNVEVTNAFAVDTVTSVLFGGSNRESYTLGKRSDEHKLAYPDYQFECVIKSGRAFEHRSTD